jgi:hypothetical protein
MIDALRGRVRLPDGRAAAPSAAIIDSRSVRASDTVSAATRGYGAGREVQGRKRHIAVDTVGLLLAVLVTPVSTEDRVAARYLVRACVPPGVTASNWSGPMVAAPVPCSSGHARPSDWWWRSSSGLACPNCTVLPRRWVVERTLA